MGEKKLDRRLYAILIDNRPMKHRNDEEDEPRTESLPQSSDTPGPGGPPHCLHAYEAITKAYRQEKAEYDRLAGPRRQALKRLSQDEVTALRELGV